MSRLNGTVVISGLPPHRGLILNVCFFPVPNADTPPPYGGNPPAESSTDFQKAFEHIDMDRESGQADFACDFSIERPDGFYYLQVRALLVRQASRQVFMQAEQFFFGRRTVQIPVGEEGHLTLPVTWRATPLESLHHYARFHPRPRRPWWKLW